jgi:MarR family transcriptional regulator, organic hydroperoxide resistance regulator
MIRADVATVLDCYPKIFFACHRRHVRDERTKRVLSSHQAGVLDHLDPVQPTHLHELAAHLGITPSSMSLMIDRLERGGYVRRSRDTFDARRINLRLTKAGLRIKEQQKVLDPNLVEAMLRQVPPIERGAALAGLRTLAAAALVVSGRASRLQKEIGS